MITTTHALWNTALLGRKEHPERNLPLVLGSVLPDVPMFLYALLMVLTQGRAGASGASVLSEFQFRRLWVDWGHSIPLAGAGLLLCLLLRNKWGLYFFAAMGLHDLEDLPVHSDYPHRHFLPFSSWRFFSPVSCYDPRHYGGIVAPLDWLLVVAAVAVLWRRDPPPWARVSLLFIAVFQGMWVLYAYTGLRWSP